MYLVVLIPMGFNVLLLPFVGHDLYMGVSVNGGNFYSASASLSLRSCIQPEKLQVYISDIYRGGASYLKYV